MSCKAWCHSAGHKQHMALLYHCMYTACAATAGPVIGITVGAIATAAVLAGAAFAAYKKLESRHKDDTKGLIKQKNDALNMDLESPFAGSHPSAGLEGAGSQPHATVSVTIPTAAVAVASAPVKATDAAANQVPATSRVAQTEPRDEGMAAGFTGEELASALRNVQHAVTQKLIFCVEDSPLAAAGELVTCY
jgi:hypothetical protein